MWLKGNRQRSSNASPRAGWSAERLRAPLVHLSAGGFRGIVTTPKPDGEGVLSAMLPRRLRADGFIDRCIPTRATKPPAGPGWVHEIKHDGYRLIVRSEGDTVRLFTRRGHDWTARYPAIAGAAAKLRANSFTMDGEAVVCGA